MIIPNLLGRPRSLAFAAVVVASINIFGGFAVMGRMLRMFTRDDTR